MVSELTGTKSSPREAIVELSAAKPAMRSCLQAEGACNLICIAIQLPSPKLPYVFAFKVHL